MDIDFRDMTRQFLQGTVAEEDTGEAALLNEATLSEISAEQAARINEDKYWDERRRTYVPVEDWSPKKLGSGATTKDVALVDIVEKVRDLLEKSGNQEALGHIEAALESIRGRANDSVGE